MNMIKLKSNLAAFVGATLLLSAVIAVPAFADSTDDEQRHEVGARALTTEQHRLIKERRAYEEVNHKVSPLAPEMTEEQKNKTEEEITAEEEAPKAAWSYYGNLYPYSYAGSHHWVTGVSLLGDYVYTEDGAGYTISSLDAWETTYWLTTDRIIITADTGLSYYNYYICNLTRGTKVLAHMTEGPYYLGAHTRWITSKGVFGFWLNDGYYCDVSSFDYDLMDLYAVNDTIVVGVNDGFLSLFNPFILINVELDMYIRSDIY